MNRRELIAGTVLVAGTSEADAAFSKLGFRGMFGLKGGSSRRNLRFGVNLSGAEYSPGNGQVFPTAGDFSYLASKGVTFVRLPIAWEQLANVLSGRSLLPI